jgi:filamentous hemagglutinin family protein
VSQFSLRHRLASISAFWAMLAGSLQPSAWAEPKNGVVTQGSATIGEAYGISLINQTSPRAVIQWDSFSIKSGETTRFNLSSGGNGATLNRVTGAMPSNIAGLLQSNGQLFMVNPNGIVVSSSGVIDAASFVGATRDVADADFMDGAPFTFRGFSNGTVTVDGGGQITAASGDVILLGLRVQNGGTLRAPKGVVGLGAGSEITYQPNASEALRVVSATGVADGIGVENFGVIQAAQAELKAAGGNAYAIAVNAGGTVNATGVSAARNGRIILTASGGGNVNIGGALTARGTNGSGRITTRGTSGRTGAKPSVGPSVSGRVIVEKNARLDAGTGGVIDLAGTISVRNYGALEAPGGQVNLQAPKADLRGTASADILTLQLSSSVRMNNLPDAPVEPLFTDLLALSTIDSGFLAKSGARAITVKASGDLAVDHELIIPFMRTTALTLEAAGNVDVNARVINGGTTQFLAGKAMNVAAPIRNIGQASDVFLRSGGKMTLSGQAVVATSGGQIVAAAGDGFFNNTRAKGSVFQTGSSGRWAVFSPSPEKTQLGGLSPLSTLYSQTQPGSISEVTRSFGAGASTVAYGSSDPNAITIPVGGIVTGGGFNDELVTGGPPGGQITIPAPEIEQQIVVQPAQSVTAHPGRINIANETEEQRAARARAEAVILQLLGLPKPPPDFFPIVLEAVTEMLGPNATPEQIAAFLASLETNEDARFALGAAMTSHTMELVQRAYPSEAPPDGPIDFNLRVPDAPLTALEQQFLQHLAQNQMNQVEQQYVDALAADYIAYQGSAYEAGNLASLTNTPGGGYSVKPIMEVLASGNSPQSSLMDRWIVSTTAGGIVGSVTVVTGAIVGSTVAATVEAAVAAASGVHAMELTAAAYAAGKGTLTGVGAANGAASMTGPAIVATIAVIILVQKGMEAAEIQKFEQSLREAREAAAGPFNWSSYTNSENGASTLQQMLNYSFTISSANYASAVQANAGTGNTVTQLPNGNVQISPPAGSGSPTLDIIFR